MNTNTDGVSAMSAELGPLLGTEEDPARLWAEIHLLRAAVQGPDGYATWQEAAAAERVRRVKAETPLTEDEAREIAFRAAKVFRPSYFTGNDFEPHQWVIHACISASSQGQREAAKRGCDMFSRSGWAPG